MKALNNLSIRWKFAVALIPLLIIIIVFDFLQIRHNYLDYNDSVRLNKAIKIGIEINHAIHEIQKERGITSGFLSNEGMEFFDDLNYQRSRTDSTIRALYTEVKKPAFNDLMSLHGSDLDYFKSYLEKINQIRDQVDQLSVTAQQSINYYSEIDEVGLNVVNKLINETRDRKAAEQVHAIIYFLKAKERASIERAIGTQAFSMGEMTNEMHAKFSSLVAGQNSFLNAFVTIADDETVDYYSRIVKGPDVDEVDRLRQVLFANTDLSVDPNYWYRMITSKIDMLKRTEDYLSDKVTGYTERIAAASNRNFWSFIIIDLVVGTLTLMLIGYIVSGLIKNMSILEDYTKKVASGDLSQKVHLDTKDEVGHYAETFNIMVEEIDKSHEALKKERDHVQYLYENVIRQSEVVFENVQQGIFLLDKDFKMSNVHSRAMEDIFENTKIAGENFGNFMRPLIIPRDLEALEMYMRHLFNEDMDEDVVNQLNPVEQVKIFTEKDGIVTTKHIRIQFTRIVHEEEIQNVMVTVSDETESVLLQQHIEEAEAKKKRETEQVLSILKIDPAVLRGFLHNSRKQLKGISERYEKNEGDDFSKLLKFTFESIHNLKGNSMLIGLDIMSEKFHSIEESIDKLKEKKEIVGSNFLTILYEIDEADKLIDDMNEMLKKVANVYKKSPAAGQVVSNIILIDSLEKGLKTMSDDAGKPVELTFTNDDNIVVPDLYINPFKDILIQLMRNTLAHGMESPNEREQSNKPVKGSIEVILDQKDKEEFIFKYRDDGSGLDPDIIKQKAIDREIISDVEAKKMSDQEVIDLIFDGRFSTSDGVDKIAGRGQGMGLVKSIIEEQEGTYSIDSSTGEYFEFEIRLPYIVEDKPEQEEPAA